MRVCFLVAAFCLLTSPLANAQWLEKTIRDSSLTRPWALCYTSLLAIHVEEHPRAFL